MAPRPVKTTLVDASAEATDAPLTLGDVDFNRRFHEDRPFRPIPPGRDGFPERWRDSRKFLFGSFIDVDAEAQPSDFTRARDDMFWQADEWVAPVVDLFDREGSAKMRPIFERALTEGIDAVPDAPQELVEFFRSITEKPSWFDRRAAERGRLLVAASTLSSTRLAASWGLFETVMTGDISSATGATGRMKLDAVRRYAETFRMFALMMKPDVYDPTSEAFQTVVRVRLMHALASRGMRRAWGDEHYLQFGEPVAAASLLGFGNGPLLSRLVDHRFGRRLSAADLDDLAMFSSWFGHLIGAPDRLLARDGAELIRSLNYIFARGGEPSDWRQEVLQTSRQPIEAILNAYLPKVLSPARGAIINFACKVFAVLFIAPMVPVFGVDEIDEYIAGADEFKLPYRLHGGLFDVSARANARAAGVRDRVPGMDAFRARLYRNGPPGIDQMLAGLSAFARRYHDIALAYTHHDNSTAGGGFGPPRSVGPLDAAG